MRRFYLPDGAAPGETARIRGDEAAHIRKVLRMAPGAPVQLVDGRGGVYDGRIESVSGDGVTVAILGRTDAATESPLAITVAQSYLKDKKMDGLIRPLTELGMARWLPFISERSVPAPDGKRLAGRTARWEKIAREAVKQCGRSRVPDIGEVTDLDGVLSATEAAPLKLVFWEKVREPLDLFALRDRLTGISSAVVLIGPEGGFTDAEADRAAAAGFQSASLGPRILRAETAALSAATLVQFLFGDMGGKSA